MKNNAFSLSLCLWAACLISNCAYHEIAVQKKEISAPSKPFGTGGRMVSYNKPQLWNKRLLTWRLDTAAAPLPKRLVEADLLREIDQSFKSWEAAGVFTFAQARVGEPSDIVISFSAPPGRTWDGQLGSMGHAAFPWSSDRGHIYLDPSEWWSTGSFALIGDPITRWLPHEIGHVLGLQHSRDEGQTMAETGPYSLPDKASFSQLRHLYAPLTPVFTWVQCVMDVSGEAE
ncbi:matrixin family metalloprotease [Prosthecobacter sp.]|uniref:matrixin family metalloprotease n=1 Tax=Prosthecobacter sp. TaxID=1965333 RepID=UPI0037830848